MDWKFRIPLFGRNRRVVAWALVDEDDFYEACGSRWTLSKGYAVRSIRIGDRVVTVGMHRQILGLGPGDLEQGDHINRDTLDNRRSNLRAVSPEGNQQNRSKRPGCSSRYRGVYWHKKAGKWSASVRHGGRQYYLGLFTSEDVAGETAAAFRRELLPYAVD